MHADRSPRAILVFFTPLALQWAMMALEVPFLAAIIGRLDAPAVNLAAFGVAYAFAILVESPVIMLMSAATALVSDGASYQRLHRFTWMLNLGATALLLVVLVPPVFDALMLGAVGLPPTVAELTRGALWLLLPWPAAIGYRRFLHGVLIRAGRTRRVAYGTGVRLATMGGTALVLSNLGLPGVSVAAAALSAGVIVEALVAIAMSRAAVRDVVRDVVRHAARGVQARPHNASAPPLRYRHIARFYYPLALTSFIGLTTKPLLTFFMGRGTAPVASLALYPVVVALVFFFGSLGLAFQEVAVALVGRELEHVHALRRFGIGLALAASGSLAAIAFTPLSDVWFGTVSGQPPDLVSLARVPLRVAVLMPLLSVALAFQRALLVQTRHTRPISIATALEVGGMALLFPLFAYSMGLLGVTAAMAAQLGGRALGVAFLVRRTRSLQGG